MSLQKTLIMAIFLVLGTTYVFKYEQGLTVKELAEQEKNSTKKIFPGLQAKEIKKISSKHESGKFLIVKSADDQWLLNKANLTNTKGATTDKFVVEEMIKTLVDFGSSNIIEESEISENQSLFGLEAPVLEIEFDTEKTSHTLRFGKKHTFSGRRYTSVSGNQQVFLVPEDSFLALNIDSDAVRNKEPFQFEYLTAVDLRIEQDLGENNKKNLEFVRGDLSSKWQLALDGKNYEIDEDFLNTALRKLSNLKVKEFIDSNAIDNNNDQYGAQYGLSPAKLTLSFKLKPQQDGQDKQGDQTPKESLVFLFGTDKDGDVFGKRLGTQEIYKFEPRAHVDFLRSAEEFRSKTPFKKIDINRLKKVAVRHGKQTGDNFSLINTADKTGTIWTLVSDNNQSGSPLPTAPERVQEWLNKLINLNLLSLSFPVSEPESTDFSNSALLEIDLHDDKDLVHRLLIGKAVESGATNAPDILAQENSKDLAPHFVLATHDYQEFVSGMIGGETWQDINKQQNYFQQSTDVKSNK